MPRPASGAVVMLCAFLLGGCASLPADDPRVARYADTAESETRLLSVLPIEPLL